MIITMEKNKFYNFVTNSNDTELYVYGDIIGGSEKWSDDDVTFKDFSDTLTNIAPNSSLNVYVNSGGGSVFTTQAIISLLQRAKDTKNIVVNCYIDGLGASCASWLPMIANNIYVYPQSIMMIHKPMSIAFGNANDMQKQIDILDKLENDVMIPCYMNKANELTEEQLKQMLSNETWLNADEICKYFNATLLESDKEIVACSNSKYFDKYNNIPKDILDKISKPEEEIVEDEPENNVDEELETKKLELENKIKELDLFVEIEKF